MIRHRPSAERGYADHGWLQSRHSFSFAGYYDPRHMGFSDLRVINEDLIAGGGGFPSHPHQDMEILTFVMSGALRHEDSMGHGSVIGPGEVQRMSAGRGVVHSEFNDSHDTPVHLLQIWVLPDRRGYPPAYEQRQAPIPGRLRRWQMLASGDTRDDSLHWHQDAKLLVTDLAAGDRQSYTFSGRRAGYLQVARGSLRINGVEFSAGDACLAEDETVLQLEATEDCETLLFDLRPA
ncbi:MAG: pirin family protein [Gammaproteobacteria bacterium]|nr:pirin family protein [Gammaproteobacteria bacterium]